MIFFFNSVNHESVDLVEFMLVIFGIIVESDFLVGVLDFEIHAVFFFELLVDLVDDSALDFVLYTVEPDDFAAHQVVGLLFGLYCCFYHFHFTRFKLLALNQFLQVMNLAINPGQWVLSLIIMQEPKLNLPICHRWYKLLLLIKNGQIHDDHHQQHHKHHTIGIKLVHEQL